MHIYAKCTFVNDENNSKFGLARTSSLLIYMRFNNETYLVYRIGTSAIVRPIYRRLLFAGCIAAYILLTI